ncbi:MAG: NAD-dependent epimerase/dehydratase family protein [Planctomycetota bacterium]|nr:NAD-dependent epimerase/dehydratase family protein [Planctomycetota bacterium]
MPTDWSNANVLVTGADGFIGAHLVRALLDRGATVFAFVCDHDPRSPLRMSGDAARVHLIDGRLEQFELVRAAVSAREIDTIFHLGAQTIVGAARRDPLTTFRSNIHGTWNVLEACRLAGPRVERLIIASSDKAYGTCPDLPYTEHTPLAGRFPYDVSKACADLLAQSYAATYALPIAIARCGNVFGPGDVNFSRLVPSVLCALLRGRRPVIRSDGSPVRDYIYIDDAVDALLALARWLDESPAADPARCAFNFGADRPLTVLEMVHRIRIAAGREDLEPIIADTAVGEIDAQHLDSRRARDVLGWRRRHAVDAALRATVPWYRRHLNLPDAAAPEPASAPPSPPARHGDSP